MGELSADGFLFDGIVAVGRVSVHAATRLVVTIHDMHVPTLVSLAWRARDHCSMTDLFYRQGKAFL